jgi:hypothetical protein
MVSGGLRRVTGEKRETLAPLSTRLFSPKERVAAATHRSFAPLA